MRVVVWALVLAALLVSVAWLVRQAEARLAFFPSRGEDVTPAAAGIAFEALDVATSDGERLRAWWLPRADAAASVLYLHGNGGNLSMWLPILADVWQQGYAVFAIDYRGYGASSGAPSESGLYRDVEAALGAFRTRAEGGGAPVVYWGRSLGAVMAAYAARQDAPSGVVLEAGFPHLRSVLSGSPLWLLSFFSSYAFPAARWMRDVRAPTLVIHGDRDSVIPYRLGRRLYEELPGPKEFFTVPGGDHNDLRPAAPEAYWRVVRDFISRLPPAQAAARNEDTRCSSA
ncbi:MAG: alpha/beta hydrolase [Acidobacteriota bacterium]